MSPRSILAAGEAPRSKAAAAGLKGPMWYSLTVWGVWRWVGIAMGWVALLMSWVGLCCLWVRSGSVVCEVRLGCCYWRGGVER